MKELFHDLFSQAEGMPFSITYGEIDNLADFLLGYAWTDWQPLVW